MKRKVIGAVVAATLGAGAIGAQAMREPTFACETRDRAGHRVDLGELTADECIRAADEYVRRVVP